MQPRLQHARHRQPGGRAGRVGARARGDHGRRRRAGGSTVRSTCRRSGATSSRSPRTRCAARAAPARSGGAASCSGMSPFNLGGEMIRSVSLEKTTWNELPYKFEAGTPAIAEAVGFGRRSTTSRRSGSTRSSATSTSCSSTLGRLGEIPWVDVYGPPPERRAGIVSFNVDGVHRTTWPRCSTGKAWPSAQASCTQPLMTKLGVSATTGRASTCTRSPGGRPPRGRAPQGQEIARVSRVEFDQLYREVILDHYKNPRNHGLLDPADARAEAEPALWGRGGALGPAHGRRRDRGGRLRRAWLRDQPGRHLDAHGPREGRTAQEVAAMPKEELLESSGSR